MNEQEVLKWLKDNPGSDAEDLLREKAAFAVAEFRKVDAAIVALEMKVRRYFPDAQYYTGSGGFNLLLGSPHDSSSQCRAQRNLAALHGKASIGDGDW